MKKLIYSITFIVLSQLTGLAQECGSRNILDTIPDRVCYNAKPLFITDDSTIVLTGSGITMIDGSTYFDPAQAVGWGVNSIAASYLDLCTGGTIQEFKTIQMLMCACSDTTFPIALPDTMCSTDPSLELDENSLQGWFSGQGVVPTWPSGSMFHPAQVIPNSYAIISYGCSGWDSIEDSIFVKECPVTGLFDSDSPESEFNIPNMVDNHSTIEVEVPFKSAKIFDLQGRMINASSGGSQITVDVESPGALLIYFELSNGTIVSKKILVK